MIRSSNVKFIALKAANKRVIKPDKNIEIIQTRLNTARAKNINSSIEEIIVMNYAWQENADETETKSSKIFKAMNSLVVEASLLLVLSSVLIILMKWENDLNIAISTDKTLFAYNSCLICKAVLKVLIVSYKMLNYRTSRMMLRLSRLMRLLKYFSMGCTNQEF